MQVVFLEAGSDTGPCRWRPSRLHTVETFGQKLVATLPDEFFWLIVLVPTNTLIPYLTANVAHDGVLHGNARQLADLSGSGAVVCVAQAMDVGEVSEFHAECAGISVHLLDEVLYALVVWEYTLLPVCFDAVVLFTTLDIAHNLTWALLLSWILVAGGHLIQVLAKVFGKNSGCIVATG